MSAVSSGVFIDWATGTLSSPLGEVSVPGVEVAEVEVLLVEVLDVELELKLVIRLGLLVRAKTPSGALAPKAKVTAISPAARSRVAPNRLAN